MADTVIEKTKEEGTEMVAAVVEEETTTKDTKKDQGEQYPAISYFSLFRYADKVDIIFMLLGSLGAIVNGAGLPVFAIFLGNIMNDIGYNQTNVEGGKSLTEIVNDAVPAFVYIGLVTFVGAYAQSFFWSVTSVRQTNRIRSIYLRKVLHQDIEYFDTEGTSGFLLQGLNEDCNAIQKGIGEKVAMFLFFMATCLSGIIIAFVRGWSMTLVILSLLPILGVAGFLLTYVTGKLTTTLNRAYAAANSLAQQALGNIRTIYAFNGESRTVKEYDECLQPSTKVGINQGYLSGTTLGLTNCIAFCAYALAMWYGGTRITAGEYTPGQVLNVLFSALIGGIALGQAAPNIQYFQAGKVSGRRVFGILAREPTINIAAGGEEPDSVTGEIEFQNVCFAYPSRPDKVVFDNFNLTVRAGQTVALVGESGSGKSTAVSLIERFYDPTSGCVTLDGHRLSDLSLPWLRSQVGLVSQEPTLFATTIRENILFGKPGASEEEVVAAAKSANAHKFISALPDGYDTQVGEKGVQMSGGQKQRIAIARAILKNPSVLLLDEATSALDAESERVVQDALDRLMVGRTTVVVAHRLSTIRGADAIAVVRRGSVIELGTHSELLEKGGAYATLVQMQQSSGEDDEYQRRISLDESRPIFGRRSGSFDIERPSEGFVKETKDYAERVAYDSGDMAPTAAPVKGVMQGYRGFTFLRKKKSMKDGKQAEEMVSKTKKTLDPEEEKVKVGMKRIAQLNKPELPALLSGVVGSAIMGLLFPIFALALASLIGGFYGYGEGEGEMTQEEKDYITSNTRKWSLVFMGMGFAALVGAFIQSYSFNFMGQRLAQRVRVMMMEALLKQEVAYFDRDANSSGALTSKLSSDAMAIRGQFGDTMGLVVQNLVTMVAGLVIAGINSWRMMLVVMAMIPILGVAATIQTKVMVAQSGDEEEMFAGANQTASEAVTSIRTVSAFGMEDQVSDLYARLLSVPTKRSYKQANFGGLGLGFSQFVLFSIYALAFWYMGLEISRGYSTFEEALKAFFAVFLAAFGLGQAQINFPDVAKGGAATKRVFAIVDRKTAIDAFNEKGVRPMECTGNIELHDVTFAYPQRPDAPVFQKFNLSVEAGKTMALVGESGSGKSTVVSLIERFYDPVDGGVLLDGQDIRDLNLHWLRSNVGLVSQEPVLFNMSVADNIRYGRPEASLEQVEEAARAANAHQFIQALPEGYSTMLGEGCIQLSGGQKQRIAIARAIVKDPKVLLLDEATSALDVESERVVQDALDRLMVGRTTIIVAHRLSTIRDADNIAVVYKGHIVEQGSHDELMSKGGSYARLVAHQMKRGK